MPFERIVHLQAKPILPQGYLHLSLDTLALVPWYPLSGMLQHEQHLPTQLSASRLHVQLDSDAATPSLITTTRIRFYGFLLRLCFLKIVPHRSLITVTVFLKMLLHCILIIVAVFFKMVQQCALSLLLCLPQHATVVLPLP